MKTQGRKWLPILWIERSRPLIQQYIKNWRDGFPVPGRKRLR